MKNDFFTTGHLSQWLQLPVDVIRDALQDGGFVPAMRINDVEHWDGDARGYLASKREKLLRLAGYSQRGGQADA